MTVVCQSSSCGVVGLPIHGIELLQLIDGNAIETERFMNEI